MATKKGSSGPVGGILVFLGSLIYLYVVFTWYGGNAVPSAWLADASFLAPFVIALAIFSSFTLFFLSIGMMSNKTVDDAHAKMMGQILWKFISTGAITLFILTGQGAFFLYAIVGFLLTFIGGMMGSM
jgi:hypothetical protein